MFMRKIAFMKNLSVFVEFLFYIDQLNRSQMVSQTWVPLRVHLDRREVPGQYHSMISIRGVKMRKQALSRTPCNADKGS